MINKSKFISNSLSLGIFFLVAGFLLGAGGVASLYDYYLVVNLDNNKKAVVESVSICSSGRPSIRYETLTIKSEGVTVFINAACGRFKAGQQVHIITNNYLGSSRIIEDTMGNFGLLGLGIVLVLFSGLCIFLGGKRFKNIIIKSHRA